MTILSPETIQLHRNLITLQEESERGPSQKEMEEFLATKSGRRGKRIADLKYKGLFFGVHVFSFMGNLLWLGVGAMTLTAYSAAGIPIDDASWSLVAIGGPAASQVLVSAVAAGVGRGGRRYTELMESIEEHQNRLHDDVQTARDSLMRSAAEDLRKQRFTITDMDEKNQMFTTHQGIVSLVVSPDGRLMAALNGSPIQSSYADQVLFDGMEVTNAAGQPMATGAPIIISRNSSRTA